MFKTNYVNPKIEKKHDSFELSFRNWILEGGNPAGMLDNIPVSIWLLENNWFEALESAWENGANPNARNNNHRQWLSCAILKDIPFNYIALAFLKMDASWWHPDNLGYTPFHYPIYNPKTVNLLLQRWIAEGHSWEKLLHPFDPMNSNLPQANQLNKWKNILH